jgi:lambda family phage minor tail protein L
VIELSAAFIAEKNKLSNAPIYLYEIEDFDGQSNDLRFASYDDDVAFDGKTYLKFPITHEAVGENTTGEIDAVTVKVSNVSRFIQEQLETYDLRGKKITITLVFANLLNDSLNRMDQIFYIDGYSASIQSVDFLCTTKFDLLATEIPARKFWRNHCTWKFKSTQCGYAGAEGVCNKTFQRCKQLANSVRFGGFPSIPSRHIYVG